jgi:hypothetical protein
MIKQWFIKINDLEEGPYSISDLKRDPRVTPATLVRKAGEKEWRPIRFVPELKAVFEDDEPEENENKLLPKKYPQNELVIDMRLDPSFLFWILIALIVALYLLYQFYGFR